jgi:DNA primase
MSVIDEVKQRTDIVDVVGQHIALKKAGRNLTGLCPFHGERNPSFFVYPQQQSWHCFGCNSGGDVFSFVMKKENMDFGEALRLLADRSGVTIPDRFERGEDKEEKEKQYQINAAAAQYFHNLLINSPEGAKARRYIDGRGFSAKTMTDFQLGFSQNKWDSLKQYLLERGYTQSEMLTAGLVSESEKGGTYDRFRDKLMFAIVDIRGHVIGFGARVLDDSLPKYINSPQSPTFDKSRSLYGLNLAAGDIRRQDQAVIVEGYIDVITAHQHGFANVIASMGTSVTEHQVSTLKKLTRNVVLALDADSAGEEAMLRAVSYENLLEAEVRVVILPKGQDPDDVIRKDPDAWHQFLAEALPIMDYTFDMIAGKLDLSQARDKSLAVRRLGPIVNALKDNIRKAHYIQKLARLTHVSERAIEAELSVMMAPQKRRSSTARKESVNTPQVMISHRLEEDFLTLLLSHPELKGNRPDLTPEYFDKIANWEVFTRWLKGYLPSGTAGSSAQPESAVRSTGCQI